MTGAERVREALAAMAGQHGPAATAVGKVLAVDETALTCTVDDGDGLPWYQVRLMPLLQVAEAQVLIPKAGAWCLLLRIESGEVWTLIWASELQAWKLQAGTVRLQAATDGLLLSKGADGLKEILTDLITEIQAIYAPKNVAAISAIQLRINNLLKPA